MLTLRINVNTISLSSKAGRYILLSHRGPVELRQLVGKREFMKSLQTTDKRIAVPKALSLAALKLYHYSYTSSNAYPVRDFSLFNIFKAYTSFAS